jgi:hypothetical protein
MSDRALADRVSRLESEVFRLRQQIEGVSGDQRPGRVYRGRLSDSHSFVDLREARLVAVHFRREMVELRLQGNDSFLEHAEELL